MRTTLNLDDGLVAAAKRTAAARGVTLTRVVEDALRSECMRPSTDRAPFKLELPVSHGHRPPDVNIADRNALYDAMEDPAGRR